MGQAKGSKSTILYALEQTFGALPDPIGTVRSLTFNSYSVVGDRERTDPETITGSRNPVEAIDGNLNVSGDAVIPLDLRNFPWLLRLAFGAPTTTGTSSLNPDNAAAVDLGDGAVSIPAAAHGLATGAMIQISGSTNYDGQYTVLAASTTDTIAITATYTAETFSGEESITVGPWTHVFKVGDTMPSFTAQKIFSDGSSTIARFTQSGLRVSRLTFEVSTSGELTATISLLGKSETKATAVLSETTVNPGFSRLNHAHAAIEEGGDAYADAKSCSVEIDFGLDQDQFVIGGGGVRGDLPEGVVKVTGSLSTLFKDVVLLDKALNGTETGLKVTYTKGTYSLACEIQEAKYGYKTPSVDGPQGVVAELSFNGHVDDGAAESVVVWTLVNDIGSYAA